MTRRLITYPDIVALFDEDEWQAALLVSKADPDFAIHHEAMVHIDNLLDDAAVACIDALVFFVLAPG